MLPEGAVLIDVTRDTGELRRLRARRAEHQQARHAERIDGHVTTQADEGALELRRTGRRVGALIEGVEHDAGGLVVRRDFDDVAVAHPAERDAVVEKQRSWILFADPLALQAGAREDEQLRIRRNLQRVKRRPKKSAAPLEREAHRPLPKLSVHVGDVVIDRCD
jgi:hypothetical protein